MSPRMKGIFYLFHICSFYPCREHEMMMTKLKKLLANSSKIRRNRRKLLNLQIQIFAWLVEFFSGLIFLIVVSVPRHSISTNVVGLYNNFIYWVFIPCIYLMNNDDFKSRVTENHLYIAFTNRFFPKSINTIDFNKDNDDDDRNRVRVNNWVGTH